MSDVVDEVANDVDKLARAVLDGSARWADVQELAQSALQVLGEQRELHVRFVHALRLDTTVTWSGLISAAGAARQDAESRNVELGRIELLAIDRRIESDDGLVDCLRRELGALDSVMAQRDAYRRELEAVTQDADGIRMRKLRLGIELVLGLGSDATDEELITAAAQAANRAYVRANDWLERLRKLEGK